MRNHYHDKRAISSAGSEHLVYTEGVGGSNPSSPTTFINFTDNTICIIGRLAQLVQSTSFTPRGSGVRTPHRPQETSTEMLEFFLCLVFTGFLLLFYITLQ